MFSVLKNGLVITTTDGLVSALHPNSDTTSILTVSYGDNLLEFNAKLNSIAQLSNVTAHTWDYKNQVIASGQAMPNTAGPENLSTK